MYIDNKALGQHPSVCLLTAGIFNNRPRKPRYTSVCDIETILNYLSKLPDKLSLLLRASSHKLALLLSLKATSRFSKICYLNNGYMIEFEDKYVFTFYKLTKSWRTSRPPLSVECCAYHQNTKLRIVQAIKSYLLLTRPRRNKNGQKQLLSALAPHQDVKRSTVDGWVKAILGSAGIHRNLFTAHSARASYTSKPKVKGLSLENILKRGNWFNNSTLQKHSRKFVSSESPQFQKRIGLCSL